MEAKKSKRGREDFLIDFVSRVCLDRAAGKRTLSVRLGRHRARYEYAGLLWLAYAMLPLYWLVFERSGWVLLPLLSLPLAIHLWRVVRDQVEGPPLNAALAKTAQLTLLFSAVLALGWVM